MGRNGANISSHADRVASINACSLIVVCDPRLAENCVDFAVEPQEHRRRGRTRIDQLIREHHIPADGEAQPVHHLGFTFDL